MSLIVRFVLLAAGSIAAIIVARDSLRFGLAQTFVAIMLIVAVVGALAIGHLLWQSFRRASSHQN